MSVLRTLHVTREGHESSMFAAVPLSCLENELHFLLCSHHRKLILVHCHHTRKSTWCNSLPEVCWHNRVLLIINFSLTGSRRFAAWHVICKAVCCFCACVHYTSVTTTTVLWLLLYSSTSVSWHLQLTSVQRILTRGHPVQAGVPPFLPFLLVHSLPHLLLFTFPLFFLIHFTCFFSIPSLATRIVTTPFPGRRS